MNPLIFTIAVVVGIWLGSKLTAAKWKGNAEEPQIRIEWEGRIYKVLHDDDWQPVSEQVQQVWTDKRGTQASATFTPGRHD